MIKLNPDFLTLCGFFSVQTAYDMENGSKAVC